MAKAIIKKEQRDELLKILTDFFDNAAPGHGKREAGTFMAILEKGLTVDIYPDEKDIRKIIRDELAGEAVQEQLVKTVTDLLGPPAAPADTTDNAKGKDNGKN